MGNFKFDTGFIYNDSFSEKEFLDAVLKNIMDDYNAPSYIFDEIVLSDVSRINVPIFLSSGKSEIQYTRLLGYDKIETTTTYRTKTYSNGFKNKTQSSSYRTITEWKQDYGTITGSATSGIVRDEYMIYDEYITNHIMDKSNVGELSANELANYSLTPKEVNLLENDIMRMVFELNITYPTNKVKDEKYIGVTDLYNSSCTIVSLYKIELTIRNKIITFIAASNGEIEIKIFGEYPADDINEIFEFNRETAKEIKEATKKPRKIANYTILSTLFLFILLLILGIVLKLIPLIIITIVILVVGLIITIKFRMDVNKISKPYRQKIAEHSMNIYERNNIHKKESYNNYIINRK